MPEQRPAEPLRSIISPREELVSPGSTTILNDSHDYNHHTTKTSSQYESHHEDQLSTFPLPFLYSTYPAPNVNTYSSYTNTHPPHHSIAVATHADYNLYQFSHLSLAHPNPLPSLLHPNKSEYDHEKDINQFSMRYATIVGIEIPGLHSL